MYKIKAKLGDVFSDYNAEAELEVDFRAWFIAKRKYLGEEISKEDVDYVEMSIFNAIDNLDEETANKLPKTWSLISYKPVENDIIL